MYYKYTKANQVMYYILHKGRNGISTFLSGPMLIQVWNRTKVFETHVGSTEIWTHVYHDTRCSFSSVTFQLFSINNSGVTSSHVIPWSL